MKRSILTAIATLILATSLQAKYKDDKIAKDDIPRNEKKLWMKIDETQQKLESSLLSGDQRFLDQLELARKKVADIMLTAEDEKKNRAAVKDLPKGWYFWKRVIAQVEIDDVNEYNLNAALGQRAPEPREEREERSQFAPASAYQVQQPQPVQVVVQQLSRLCTTTGLRSAATTLCAARLSAIPATDTGSSDGALPTTGCACRILPPLRSRTGLSGFRNHSVKTRQWPLGLRKGYQESSRLLPRQQRTKRGSKRLQRRRWASVDKSARSWRPAPFQRQSGLAAVIICALSGDQCKAVCEE
jgi:hypothetical protein